MYVTSKVLDYGALERIALEVGRETYRDNVRAEGERVGPTRSRVKLGARDSREIGARRSWSGRRGPWTCWHAFRDVFAAWLAADPDAVIRTGLEVYRGAAGFLDLFPATGDRNVGSMMDPVALADLCACELEDPVTGPGRDLDYDARDYVAELTRAWPAAARHARVMARADEMVGRA